MVAARAALAISEVRTGKMNDDLRGLTWWGPGCGFTAHFAPNTTEPDYLDYGWGTKCASNPAVFPQWPCAEATGYTDGERPVNTSARSWHPGGVVAGLCDGSVRFISESIDLTTWRALSTMDGGETLGAF